MFLCSTSWIETQIKQKSTIVVYIFISTLIHMQYVHFIWLCQSLNNSNTTECPEYYKSFSFLSCIKSTYNSILTTKNNARPNYLSSGMEGFFDLDVNQVPQLHKKIISRTFKTTPSWARVQLPDILYRFESRVTKSFKSRRIKICLLPIIVFFVAPQIMASIKQVFNS